MTAPTGGTMLRRLGRELWYYSLVRGIIAVVFGILVLIWPLSAILVGVIWLGVFWIVDGVLAVVAGARRRGTPGAGWEIAFGVIGVLAGLFLAIQPLKAATTLMVIAGIWAILGGLTIGLWSLRARGVPGWGWGVAMGVVTLVFGILVLASPGIALATFVLFVGWYAILLGVSLVVLALRIRKLAKAAAPESTPQV